MESIKDSINKAIYGDSANKDTGDNLGRSNEGTTQRSQTGTGLGRDVTSDTGNASEAKYKPYEPTNPMRHDPSSGTKLGAREQIGTHEETASGFGKPAPSSDISAIGGRSENVGGTSNKDTYTPGMQSLIHEESSKTELPISSSYNTGDNTSSSTYNTSDPNTNTTRHKDDHQRSSALGGLTSGGLTSGGLTSGGLTSGGLTSGGLTSSSDRKHDTGFSSAHDSGLSSGAYGTDKSGLTSTHRDATPGSIPGPYDTGNTGLSGTHSTRDTTSHHDKAATGAGVAGLGYALASGKPSASDHSRTSAFTEDTSSSGIGHKQTPTTHDTTTSGHSYTAKPSSSVFAGTGASDFSRRGDESGLGSTGRDSHTRDTTSSSHTYENKPSTSVLGGVLGSGHVQSHDNHSPLGHTERDTPHDTTTSSRAHDNKPSAIALGGVLGSGLGTHDNRHSSGLPSSQTDNSGIGRSQPDAATSHLGSSSGLPSSRTDNSGIGRSQPDAATSHLGSTSTSHTGTHSHDRGNASPTNSLPLDNSAPAGPTNVSKDVQGNPSSTAGALGEPPEPSALAGVVHGGPSTTATGSKTAGTSQAPNIPSLSEQGANRPTEGADRHTETPKSRAAEANKGTDDAYEKSTGLAAEGGDFDASRPGAGREADRLLDEHGITHEKPSDKKHGLGLGGHSKDTSGAHTGTDTDTKASHTGLGEGATGHNTTSSGAHTGEEKVKITDKIKDKLHLGPKH